MRCGDGHKVRAGSGWAKLTYLPYMKASPYYEITGVLNSSQESSQRAIKTFGLSGTAKSFVDIDSWSTNRDCTNHK
ncbi:hypothetical protein EJ04DRAFT_517209 [Polyplosphaeria fusca]|uniref:Uncharacterized protein n=1 Tax=Polyplosphaeria fusca TaxID=682080 RepID=A0A9P4QHP8_9PLEO|nr:hypothetical protein EJ04DRAFT_517209 [Polyplosphaeria fusca]